MLFTALADCPACRVQGAVVETWDSQTPGTPVAARCRMCTRELEGGVETRPPAPLARLSDVDAALARWAREEGFDTPAELAHSAFVSGTVASIHSALILGEPVETSFDVMGFLFSHMGGASPGVSSSPSVAAPRSSSLGGPAPSLAPLQERGFDPRNELLALAATAAADGAVAEVEVRFLEAYAAERGLRPLVPGELRVHRPDEVGPVGGLLDRERVIERMVQVAFVDGDVLDESEARVIRGFARAWGVDPARVDDQVRAWTEEGRGLLARLLSRAARHLLPEA